MIRYLSVLTAAAVLMTALGFGYPEIRAIRKIAYKNGILALPHATACEVFKEKLVDVRAAIARDQEQLRQAGADLADNHQATKLYAAKVNKLDDVIRELSLPSSTILLAGKEFSRVNLERERTILKREIKSLAEMATTHARKQEQLQSRVQQSSRQLASLEEALVRFEANGSMGHGDEVVNAVTEAEAFAITVGVMSDTKGTRRRPILSTPVADTIDQ